MCLVCSDVSSLLSLPRRPAGTPWAGGGHRDVHAGVPGPRTLRQLLDAPHPGELPAAAQVPGVRLRLLAAGVGAQGRPPQRTHADPVLEA